MSIKSLFKKVLIVFVLLTITLPTVKQILRPGFFPVHDDIQGMRLLEMDKCIKDGQVPCRWVPDMGYGYGYPQFNYYGPLPYYVMEIFHLSGMGYLDSVKAGMVLITIISVFGMYLLASSLWGAWGGVVGAILYVYAPYRAVNFYVRGDIGELAALAIVPFMFWLAKKALDGYKKSVIWLALSIAALLTSHNISTLIFLPILGLWLLFLALVNRDEIIPNKRERITNLILGGIWGLSLGAFFVVPAWLEKNYAHIETILQGYFNYLAHFVSIKQLLFSTYWNYGSSEAGPWDEIYLGVGILHWILPLLAAPLLFVFKKNKKFLFLFFLIAVGWFALFLSHEKSSFIWNHVSILSYLQFPWRFLLVSTFCFSLAGGAVSVLFKTRKQLIILTTSIFIFSLLLYSSYFKPSKWLDVTDAQKFSGISWTQQMTVSIFDYLPIYAAHPPTSAAPDKPNVIEGEVETINGIKGSDWQKWNVQVVSTLAVLRLPLFDFPGWQVRVDSKAVNINHDNELGLITINLSSGNHEIYAKLTNTPIRTLANAATIVGLITIPLYLIIVRKKK